jgi:hypothetical protein
MEATYPPVGHCIYCMADDVELTKEHIVAYGLGGNLVLPKSSCKDCAKVTGTIIEQSCLRKTFRHNRNRYGLPTRNPKERDRTFTITIGEEPNTWTKELPIEELPLSSWALPTYGWPGLLLQTVAPKDCPPARVQANIGQEDAQRLLVHGHGLHPVGMTAAQFDVRLFERMLAKIGHAFAYAELGAAGFEPCLQKLILEGHSHQTFWIGEDKSDVRIADDTLYDLRLLNMVCSNGARFLTVRIRIFGWLATPAYMVVVGTLRDPDARPPPTAWRARLVDIKRKYAFQ